MECCGVGDRSVHKAGGQATEGLQPSRSHPAGAGGGCPALSPAPAPASSPPPPSASSCLVVGGSVGGSSAPTSAGGGLPAMSGSTQSLGSRRLGGRLQPRREGGSSDALVGVQGPTMPPPRAGRACGRAWEAGRHPRDEKLCDWGWSCRDRGGWQASFVIGSSPVKRSQSAKGAGGEGGGCEEGVARPWHWRAYSRIYGCRG